MNIKRILGILIAVAGIVLPAHAQIYVDNQDASCNDAGAGTVSEPFCTIQAAYDSAPDGGEIRVLPGTYAECVFLFDIATAKSIDVVAEAWRTGGDNTVTVLDATTVAAQDCEFATSGAPASVVNIGGTNSSFTGFTVTGGTASGIFGVGSVAITNNVVQGNSSTIGGGIYVYSGNCYYGNTTMTIADNDIRNNAAAGQGGGLSIAAGLQANAQNPDPVTCPSDGDATVTLSGNQIEMNSADSSGGGIFATVYTNDQRQATVAITTNQINGNTASTPDTQGGIIGYGAGVYGLTYGYGTERIEVTDNTITGNSTLDFGGGMQLTVFPTEIASSNDHHHLVRGNTVSGNSAGAGGAGLEVFASVLGFTAPQTFSVLVEDNDVLNNIAGTSGGVIIDDPALSFGGGGILATFESFSSTSPNMDFRIEDNRISGNQAKVLGGGVSLFIDSDAQPQSAVAPSEATIQLTNNLVADNDTNSSTVDSVGAGVFAFLNAKGPATATLEAELNTIASNANDNQTEPGGFHVESQTVADSSTSPTDGTAEVLLDSSILSDNSGVGFGGPFPGSAGIKTAGGSAEFVVTTTYNDLFGHVAGNFDTWVVPGTGNLSDDPLLNATTYIPERCSPTIDTGNPVLDFSMEPGPNGGRANMGHTGTTVLATRSPADVNGDSVVDGIDILRLSVAFGTMPADARYNPAVDFVAPLDLIDGDDLAVMTADFNQPCTQP